MKVKLLNLEQKVDDLETKAWNTIRDTQQKIAEDKSAAFLMEEKMRGTLRGMLQHFQGQWERLSAQLHSLSPLNILKKGYALCWRDGGQYLIRRIDEVKKEEELTVSFYKGEFDCLVKKIDRKRLIESRLNKK
jgi:exodeoxyribonuclease VII large subunit